MIGNREPGSMNECSGCNMSVLPGALRIYHHLDAPKGFTQSFDCQTIDVLERLGLIRLIETNVGPTEAILYFQGPN